MAQRKLQQEIDKVIKKVKEGTLEFDYLYEKLTTSENLSQKEKLEGDLKKEIKKLQRSRDQIKTWMSGNEVKDKSQLAEMRREIETDMEKFKDIEKEMKTKAFSKQGLNMQQKLDPREREKLEMANFIQSMIEEIELQSESLELRIDSLSSSKRKLTSKKQEELKDNQEKLDRNNYHQTQLETILRLLENGDLETDDITEIKEDIEYYVEHNQEDLFVDDDSIYDVLGLESKEEYFNGLEEKEESVSSIPPPSPPPPPSSSTATAENRSSPPVPSPPPLGLAKRVVSNSTPTMKPIIPTTNSTTSVNSIPSTTPVAKMTPKVKYASIIAANQLLQQQQQQQQPPPPQPLSALPTNNTGPPGLTRITTNTTTASSSMTRENTQSPQLISRSKTVDAIQCESIKDLLPSLDGALKSLSTPAKFEDISEYLKSSLLTCPDSFDSDKRKNYYSDSPTRTFVYYPQEPLILLTNNTKNLSLYDDSTLFYIFYHHKLPPVNIAYHTTYGDYLKYSAIQELNKRGWNFNEQEQKWISSDKQQIFDHSNWSNTKLETSF